MASPNKEEELVEIEGEQVSPHVYRCADGKYRWVYEFAMMKNPVVLFTVWNVFGIAFVLIAGVTLIIDLIGGNIHSLADCWNGIWPILAVAFLLMALGVIAYLILAKTYGWKYMVLFEMDEETVTFIQMKKTYEKAQALGWLTTMAGIAAGNATTVGIGLTSAARDRLTTEFSRVRKIKPMPRFHTIKVNELLYKNQIYAEPEDFDFVLSYIQKQVQIKRAEKEAAK